MKDKRDELTCLCDALENCNKKKCEKNEIVCAKAHLKRFVGVDKNKLLKIKAQMKMHEDDEKTTFSSVLSLVISVVSLCLVTLNNVYGEDGKIVYALYATMALLAIAALAGRYLIKLETTRKRKKWEKYIQFAMVEVEEELFSKS